MKRFSNLIWAYFTSYRFSLFLNFTPLYIFLIYGVFFKNKALQDLGFNPLQSNIPYFLYFFLLNSIIFEMLETLSGRATNVLWALEVEEQYVNDQHALSFKMFIHQPIYLQRWNQILTQLRNKNNNILQFNIKPYNEAIVLESFFQIFDHDRQIIFQNFSNSKNQLISA
jgi:hypothetical protein